MGNSSARNINTPASTDCDTTKGQQNFRARQIKHSNSLENIIERFSFSFHRLSFTAGARHQSFTAQASRPWSRVSRKRWNDSTLADPHSLSKTCWPVSHIESLFLPQFAIKSIEQNYSAGELIAKGAFGKVYKVDEKLTGKKYALKILCKSQIIDGNSVKQLKDEVDIQTICGHHPFIAQCLAYWQNKKKVFLLSEYISNGELFQKIKTFSYELVQLYVAEIAIAIDFLHNAGIIYRDLKPENILLDADYHIKLIDFGLSKWLSIGNRTNTMCGTLQYMAPEILNGDAYGHAVDWWALGVIACRMLTDSYPNTTIPENEELFPESVASLRHESKDLLHRLLERNPQYRLKSLLSLQRIAIYKNYKWNDVKQKKICPKVFIEEDALLESGDYLITQNNHHFVGF